MDIAALNAAPAVELAEVLCTCADVDRWAGGIVNGRPYRDADALLERAALLAGTWSDDEVLGALQAHPRIGERSTSVPTQAAMSAAEQHGVGDEAEILDRLREGNLAYEKRFGTVFLIRAAGRSGSDMLAELDRRLGNEPTTEIDETRAELTEIAMLRLRELLRP